MSALAGCFGAAGVPYAEACRQMLAAQQAYGANPVIIEGQDAAMGKAPNRLIEPAIIARHANPPGRYLFVGDVRIDNRDDLAARLGRAANDLSDCDLFAEAWVRWQSDCLESVVGDFAVAVFDRDDRSLTLARDPTGQRPLFYAQQDGVVAFASMPTGLLACPLIRAGFNFFRLSGMMLGAVHPGDDSYFDGIRRVLPGRLTRLTATDRTEQEYWSPNLEPLALDDDHYVEAYRATLEQSVRPRLRRSSGGLGAQLSSGFDSSAVAAVAASLSEEPLWAFTSAPRAGFTGDVPRGRIADESALAALTAERYGMRHRIVRPEGGLLSQLRLHSRLYQEPDRNVVNMQWWSAIHDAAREVGVSTLLTGQLGNFTLNAGGLPTLAAWVGRGAWRSWWQEARAAAARPDVRWRGVLINSFEGRLPLAVVHGLRRGFAGAPDVEDQSFVRREWLDSLEQSGALDVGARSSGDPYADRLQNIRWTDTGMLRKGALAEGVDERDPMADPRLIEFSLRLPPEQLLHDGVLRPLAHKALAQLLPSQLLTSPLRGYQGADWFERLFQIDVRQLFEEVRSSPAVNELLDVARIARAIDDWPSGDWSHRRRRTIYRTRLTIALSTAVFLQEFEPLLRPPSAPAY